MHSIKHLFTFWIMSFILSAGQAFALPAEQRTGVEDVLIHHIVTNFKRSVQDTTRIVRQTLNLASSKEEAATYLAIMQKESTFNPYARSQDNYGIMQINRPTWGNTFTSIEANIQKGVAVFRGYAARTLDHQLTNYNKGPGGARSSCNVQTGQCRPYEYITKIKKYRADFLALMNRTTKPSVSSAVSEPLPGFPFLRPSSAQERATLLNLFKEPTHATPAAFTSPPADDRLLDLLGGSSRTSSSLREFLQEGLPGVRGSARDGSDVVSEPQQRRDQDSDSEQDSCVPRFPVEPWEPLFQVTPFLQGEIDA